MFCVMLFIVWKTGKSVLEKLRDGLNSKAIDYFSCSV